MAYGVLTEFSLPLSHVSLQKPLVSRQYSTFMSAQDFLDLDWDMMGLNIGQRLIPGHTRKVFPLL